MRVCVKFDRLFWRELVLLLMVLSTRRTRWSVPTSAEKAKKKAIPLGAKQQYMGSNG